MNEKPDYRDYKISKNIYQKKYINKEREPFLPYFIRLISLILTSLFFYLLFGDGDSGTSESYFENFLVTWWIELGSNFMWFSLITGLSFVLIYWCLKEFLDRIGITWYNDNRKYKRYEDDLEEWKLNKD